MCGVARDKETGSFFDWHGKVKGLVIGYPDAIFKKFRSVSISDAFVERMKVQVACNLENNFRARTSRT